MNGHRSHLNHLRLHSGLHLLGLHRHHAWLLVLQLIHSDHVLRISGLSRHRWLSKSHLHGYTLLPELILLLLLVLLELFRAHHSLMVAWHYRRLIHHHLLRRVVHHCCSCWRLHLLHRHSHGWLTISSNTVGFLLCHNLFFFN